MKLALMVAGGLTVICVFFLQGWYMLRTGESDFFLGAWLSHSPRAAKSPTASNLGRAVGLIFLAVGSLATYWIMPAMALVAAPVIPWISANWVWLFVIVSNFAIGFPILRRPERVIETFGNIARVSPDPAVLASIRLLGIAFIAAGGFFIVAWIRQ